MNVLPRRRRGKETFPFGNRTLSITGILREPGVVEYLESNGSLTDGARQNKLRRKLRVGNFNKGVVDEFLRQRQHQRQRKVARRPGPRRGRQGQTFEFGEENRTLTEILDGNPGIRQAYEARGVRTPLAQKNRLRRDLMEGRDPLAPIPPRRRGPSEASPIIINGERLAARQALEPAAPRISSTGKKALGKSAAHETSKVVQEWENTGTCHQRGSSGVFPGGKPLRRRRDKVQARRPAHKIPRHRPPL